ncbi:hypothetical protein MM440_16460 [Arsenicicoccus piscis]|uniref:MFS transporter n=1 Tax=Arsenicicoccus piscis TaxID=673954 RepID=UPI001F4D042E|nr:MFS transporter [Arsenicicoccus piscis]MCH8629320.1 hypothetical protein [Arsenicicoccus piscis]
MSVLLLPVLVVDQLPVLAAVLLVAGSAIAPTLITAMMLAQRLVPESQINEGMTIVMTGLLIGIALGSSAAGGMIDAYGASRAFLVPVLAAFLAFALALLGRSTLVSAERRAMDLFGSFATGSAVSTSRRGSSTAGLRHAVVHLHAAQLHEHPAALDRRVRDEGPSHYQTLLDDAHVHPGLRAFRRAFLRSRRSVWPSSAAQREHDGHRRSSSGLALAGPGSGAADPHQRLGHRSMLACVLCSAS